MNSGHFSGNKNYPYIARALGMIFLPCLVSAGFMLITCATEELKGKKGCEMNCEALYHSCTENCRSSQLPAGLEGAPQNNVARWDSVECISRCDKFHERCHKDCSNYKSFEMEQ